VLKGTLPGCRFLIVRPTADEMESGVHCPSLGYNRRRRCRREQGRRLGCYEMKIAHIAIWVKDIEQMRAFYELHFGVVACKKYVNPAKHFESYFLEFESGARIELMRKPSIKTESSPNEEHRGFAHLAISVGSKERVIDLTESMRLTGCPILGEPRTTGDGYFESVVLDPEGNRIEITV
jgi:lactoylglutathione lyase